MADTTEGLGRRTFLNRVAMAAGAAQLSPQLFTQAEAAESPTAPNPAHAQNGQTKRLAAYAAGLRYEDIPAPVRQRIVNAITDTAGVILYGGKLQWSEIVIAHAKRTGPGGKSAILGMGNVTVQAP